MSSRLVLGRDGAVSSTSMVATAVTLVACPLPMAGAISMPASGSVEALYRLAYEQAVAASRPSAYRQALRTWDN